MIEIDKDIPRPLSTKGSKYPFERMDLGDSFFVPGITSSHLSNGARQWGRHHNMKFVVRKEADGARVWRVE